MAGTSKTISEMCAEFDVTPRTLRFYESKGLITPTRVGNRRLYSKPDRVRMKLILRAKRFGFSLKEIRALLAPYDVDRVQHRQLARTFQIGQQRLAKMKRQRRELDLAITDLEQQLKWGARILASFKKQTVTE